MSFDSPSDNVEKDFPGLYASEPLNDTEDEHDKQTKKKEKKEKKDKQKDKKDKGYQMFEEDDDGSILDDIKSPGKLKKAKPFKFQKKEIFSKSKDKEIKKEGKEKRKEDKESKKDKIKSKDKKKLKHGLATTTHITVVEKPVFGVPLVDAVERSKCHDGIELPALVRECIDYIEEYGLTCEGIYRISGVKSKVQQLKDAYNKGLSIDLCEHEPNIIASLLKQFLRELPEPVLTTALIPKFEESATIRNEERKVESFSKLLGELPRCNRLLVSWMIVHMSHIIQHHQRNKMTLQNVSIVLSPTMQISHRVLNIFFSHCAKLFKDTTIKRYIPPLKPASSKWSLELPDTPAALEEELAKQESVLTQLHEQIKSVKSEDPEKHEQLWEVQRIVTQLKRKIKLMNKSIEAAEKRRKDKTASKISINQVEVLNLEMRQISVESLSSREKVTIETQAVVENETSPEIEPDVVKDRGVQVEAENVTDSVIDEIVYKDTQQPVDNADVSCNEDEPNVKNADPLPEQSSATENENDSRTDYEKTTETTVDIPNDNTDNQTQNLDSTVHDEKMEIKEQVSESQDAKGEENEVCKETSKSNFDEVIHAEIINFPNISNVEPDDYDLALDFTLPENQSTNERGGFTDLPVDLSLPKIQDGRNRALFSSSQFTQEVMTPIKLANTSDMDDIIADHDPSFLHKEFLVQEEELKSEEREKLQELEYTLILEEEELRAIGDELRKKLETEKNEIERLQQEITELQMMRQDSDCEEYSSSSESSIESDGEGELRDVLNNLIAENEALEKQNSELCQKIHEERMICLGVKVQIRLIQQKQLSSDNILDRDNPF